MAVWSNDPSREFNDLAEPFVYKWTYTYFRKTFEGQPQRAKKLTGSVNEPRPEKYARYDSERHRLDPLAPCDDQE